MSEVNKTIEEFLFARTPAGGALTVDPNVASVVDTTVGVNQLHGAALGETLGEAMADLPGDLTAWLGHWLDGLHLTGAMSGIVNALIGASTLQWFLVGFLGLRIFTLGRNLLAPAQRSRGPVSLVYYRVAKNAVDPVVAYLRNERIEVREVNQDGEYALIGAPIYHRGRADRAFAHLAQQTGLKFARI